MIPLLHIATFISFLFCLFAVGKLYPAYRKMQNINIGDFLKLFILLGIYFFLVSLPATLLDPIKVQIIYTLSYIPILLSAIFFLKVAFRLLQYPHLINYISPVIYGLTIFVTIFNILGFSPAQMRTSDSMFYHWGEGTPLWLQTSAGILFAIFATGASFLFFFGGKKSQEKVVRARAFLMGGGFSILIIAAIANYSLPFLFLGTIRWIMSVLASFFALFGLILILIGIYYKIEKIIRSRQ